MNRTPLRAPLHFFIVDIQVLNYPQDELIQLRFIQNRAPHLSPIIHDEITSLEKDETSQIEVSLEILNHVLVLSKKDPIKGDDKLYTLKLEVKDISDLLDLSPANDGSILVSINDNSHAWETPSYLCTVGIQYTMFDQDGKILEDLIHSNSFKQIQLDECQCPDGLEIVLRSMTTTSWVYALFTGKYAFKSLMDPPENCSPPLTTLHQETHLHGLTLHLIERHKEPCELNVSEKFERGRLMLRDGNKWFRLKDHERAFRRYKMGIEALEYLGGKSTKEDTESCQGCLLNLRINLLNSLVELESYSEAIKYAEEVILQDEKNYKIFLLKIIALTRSGLLLEAENLCNKSIINFPDQLEFRRCREKIFKIYQNDKSLKNMYQRFWD